jgi:Tol biopolymer transport system component
VFKRLILNIFIPIFILLSLLFFAAACNSDSSLSIEKSKDTGSEAEENIIPEHPKAGVNEKQDHTDEGPGTDKENEATPIISETDEKNDEGKNNIVTALEQVTQKLEKAEINKELELIYNTLEDIRSKEWNKYISGEELAGKYIKLASVYLGDGDARQHISIIKDCAEKASLAGGEKLNNPFLYFVKGLIKQYEGDMEKAVNLVRKAAGIAKNNKDIELWLRAFDAEKKEQRFTSKEIFLEQLGIDGSEFDIYAGTIWLDNEKILTVVSKETENSRFQRLIKLDTNTMEFDEIYHGNLIQLKFITADKKYAVLIDNGLKLVNLEDKTVVAVSTEGYQCSLSPDGKSIAYTESGIWLYDIKTGSKREICSGKDDSSPIWFPDGKSILFIGNIDGKEPGGGAEYLQGIFTVSVNNSESKQLVLPDWESKFHYINWIVPGELVHVEELCDGEINSVIMDIYGDSRRTVGSVKNQDDLIYDEEGYNIYVVNRRGTVAKLDFQGRTMARYKYGDIWGDSFGVIISSMKIAPGSENAIFFYGTTLSDEIGLWMADANFENYEFITGISRGLEGEFSVSPSGLKMVVKTEKDKLELFEID